MDVHDSLRRWPVFVPQRTFIVQISSNKTVKPAQEFFNPVGRKSRKLIKFNACRCNIEFVWISGQKVVSRFGLGHFSVVQIQSRELNTKVTGLLIRKVVILDTANASIEAVHSTVDIYIG